MIRRITTLIVALWALSLNAQPLADYSQPTTLEIGRLAPRGEINPYPSRDEAIADSRTASEYIIPLNDWQVTENDEAITYATRFKVSYKWSDRVVLLRIDDATSAYEITINGKAVGYSQAGRGRAEFNLTKECVENYNNLEIKVFKHSVADVLENDRAHGDASFRAATIISQPKVRIRDINVTSTYSIGQSNMTIQVDMESHLLNPKEFKVYYELIAPDGSTAARGNRTFTTEMLKGDNVVFFATVDDALPWNHETPYLYVLLVRTQYEGRFKEYVTRRVGFRDAEYADGRILLNGNEVEMVSAEACFRENYSATFNALSELKQSGVNTIVVKGGPQPEDFYLICDRLGLYVVDCADIDTSRGGDRRVGGNPTNNPNWTAAYVDRADRMYHSSKNHTSVVGFSPAANSSNGICLYESFLHLKSLEGKRPILYTAAEGEWNNDPISFDSQLSESGGIRLIGDRVAEGFVSIANDSKLAPLRAELHCVVKQGGVVRSEKFEPVRIAPGTTYISAFSVADIKPKRKAIVTIELVANDISFEYQLPSNEPQKLTLREEMFGVRETVARHTLATAEFEIKEQE